MKHLNICLLLFLIGCLSEKHQFISKPRANNNDPRNRRLKLNGCYYATYQNPRDSSTELGYFFFYENGIALFSHAGEIPKDSIFRGYFKTNIEKNISFNNSFFKSKEAGGFTLTTNKIQIQVYRFVPSPTWGLCTFTGEILNDTTIYISACEMKKRIDYCRENFYLKFLAMNKPDSSNQFMNKKWYWQSK